MNTQLIHIKQRYVELGMWSYWEIELCLPNTSADGTILQLTKSSQMAGDFIFHIVGYSRAGPYASLNMTGTGSEFSSLQDLSEEEMFQLSLVWEYKMDIYLMRELMRIAKENITKIGYGEKLEFSTLEVQY